VLRCLPDERRGNGGDLPSQGINHGNDRNGRQRLNNRGAGSSEHSPFFPGQTRAS
jgi:hypothetical protein